MLINGQPGFGNVQKKVVQGLQLMWGSDLCPGGEWAWMTIVNMLLPLIPIIITGCNKWLACWRHVAGVMHPQDVWFPYMWFCRLLFRVIALQNCGLERFSTTLYLVIYRILVAYVFLLPWKYAVPLSLAGWQSIPHEFHETCDSVTFYYMSELICWY